MQLQLPFILLSFLPQKSLGVPYIVDIRKHTLMTRFYDPYKRPRINTAIQFLKKDNMFKQDSNIYVILGHTD